MQRQELEMLSCTTRCFSRLENWLQSCTYEAIRQACYCSVLVFASPLFQDMCQRELQGLMGGRSQAILEGAIHPCLIPQNLLEPKGNLCTRRQELQATGSQARAKLSPRHSSLTLASPPPEWAPSDFIEIKRGRRPLFRCYRIRWRPSRRRTRQREWGMRCRNLRMRFTTYCL